MYGGDWIWLTESEFTDQSLKTRRRLLHDREPLGKIGQVPSRLQPRIESQLTDSRIVWWPSTLDAVGDKPLLTFVEDGLPPSRHREVTSRIWSRASRLLPGAADLAGRFPAGSGPNCFGNVMAAAGVPGADKVWMQREPFEEWLVQHTSKVSGTQRDGQPGLVLVWRNHDGQVEHAAVTIGDGYTINKPSQGWFSPHLVWTVQETVAASRYAGVTLTRHLMSE